MALHSEIEKREEDPVSISIGEMLTELSLKSAEPCISRVPNYLRQMIRYFSEKCPDYLRDMINRSSDGFKYTLHRDMLLLENQLPFFVIWELFHMIESSSDDQDIFIEAIFDMLLYSSLLPGKARPKDELKSLRFETIKHLLDFMYHCCFHPSTSEMKDRLMNQNVNFKFIRCATGLKEAGIKFKFVQGRSMFDVRFENETLYIPKIKIQDEIESVFRNLIAFEQLFLADTLLKHATDYMILMDYLIDSPKDVEILCQSEIVENSLGDDNALATMINSLGVSVVYIRNRFYYAEVFNKINTHCSRPWNRRMANLKHNYFNSPWAFLSVLAATLLLLLTLLQTVFSVLTYAQ